MAKLHELLAVCSNLEAQATKTRLELQNTFEKKRHLFGSKRVTFTPSNAEDGQPVTEDQSDIQTTVKAEVNWLSGFLVKGIDSGHMIDVANTLATADVMLEDGTVVLSTVPATSLLQLEKRLKEVHDFISAIPTLDPAKGFVQDPAREEAVFKAREVTKTRTKKTLKVLTLAPATDKHPAQCKEYTEDVPIGAVLEQEWSSLITPAVKADLLERCENLTRAVKQARARANDLDLDVKGHKIGKALLDFIFQPLSQ